MRGKRKERLCIFEDHSIFPNSDKLSLCFIYQLNKMVTYNSVKFNNIIVEIEKILKNNKIDIEDTEAAISIAAIADITSYVQSILEPPSKFVSTLCPKCAKPHLVPIELTYKRNIIFRLGNILIKLKITISRLKCENCGSKPAILPDFCIPFKQYSTQCILSIAEEASISSTEETASKLNIEPKQVRRLVNIVKSNKNNILLIYQMHKKEFNENINANFKLYILIKALPNNIAELYFNQFKSIFLYVQKRRKIYIIFEKLLT